MKVKKEDWNYAAGVATGMSKGSNKPAKLKNKYKFKPDVSSLSGMGRSYYEEKSVKDNTVAAMLNTLLEEVERSIKESKPVKLQEEEPDAKLLEDYKLIKFVAQKGINEVSNNHNNKKLMNDILEIAKRYEGDNSLGEMATEFGDTKSMDSYHQEELEDGGKNNPTE